MEEGVAVRCLVPGCTYPMRNNGLCDWHRRNGTPEGFTRPKRATLEPQAAQPAARKGGRPRCDACGGKDPRKSYRLDENLRPSYRLLDAVCRTRLGYREVSYERPYAEIHGRSIMRGAV